ncbi:hypothetical protein QVD17_16069 [Tagetes erecta]|uniref:Uncharacterized protein n=1 Tax=Tagetes erecta TaxID=13708 RepID=A0AAD8KUF9_TARER|nr:hypothetical protein QVD17_16069 [Tagetes erecta]
MDVAPAMDLDLDSLSYGGGYYTSTPSSPTQLTELYWELDDGANQHCNRTVAAVPFAWEEKPGVPKTMPGFFSQDDFSFDVSGQLDSSSVPAEDLFHGGVIRTVDLSHQEGKVNKERGRERGISSSRVPSSRSRRTRSLPPDISEHRGQQMAPPSSVSSSDNGSRIWSFIDLLLFRSASDGRAMDADPLKKYSAKFRKHDQDIRNSGSMSKRTGRLSAHELHYNVNRAVSIDMKKKTYLPYKQGLLGKFSFNP